MCRWDAHFADPASVRTGNTVELIPTLGALVPRGGPVPDLVLTASGACVALHTGTPASKFSRFTDVGVDPGSASEQREDKFKSFIFVY